MILFQTDALHNKLVDHSVCTVNEKTHFILLAELKKQI